MYRAQLWVLINGCPTTFVRPVKEVTIHRPSSSCSAKQGEVNATSIASLPYRPSIQQAARYLGVDPKTVRRYIAQGRLKAVRIGPRLIRVERESLVALAKPIGGY